MNDAWSFCRSSQHRKAQSQVLPPVRQQQKSSPPRHSRNRSELFMRKPIRHGNVFPRLDSVFHSFRMQIKNQCRPGQEFITRVTQAQRRFTRRQPGLRFSYVIRRPAWRDYANCSRISLSSFSIFRKLKLSHQLSWFPHTQLCISVMRIFRLSRKSPRKRSQNINKHSSKTVTRRLKERLSTSFRESRTLSTSRSSARIVFIIILTVKMYF